MAKILENAYRYVNIALVNEAAVYCDRVGIDIWDVLRCADTKPFGFSAFRPGPGVGGHCIPVDPRYLMARAAEQGFTFHTLGAARAVLDAMPDHVAERARDLLVAAGKDPARARVTLLGVAYKADVADTRESPAYPVARALRALGSGSPTTTRTSTGSRWTATPCPGGRRRNGPSPTATWSSCSRTTPPTGRPTGTGPPVRSSTPGERRRAAAWCASDARTAPPQTSGPGRAPASRPQQNARTPSGRHTRREARRTTHDHGHRQRRPGASGEALRQVGRRRQRPPGALGLRRRGRHHRPRLRRVPESPKASALRDGFVALFGDLARRAGVAPQGSIDREQFLRAAGEIVQGGAATFDPVFSPVAKGIVGLADRNGDGVIDGTEFATWLTALGLGEAEARDAFKQIDTDGDGTLSEQELLAAVRKFHLGELDVELLG